MKAGPRSAPAPGLRAWPLPRARAARRRRPPISVLVAFTVLAVVLFWAAAPAVLAPVDPAEIRPAESLQTPSAAHALGTDQLGRDILSRVMYGARTALFGALIVTAGSLLIGTAIALVAGYRGGLVDSIAGRVVDVIYALPPLIVAILVVGVFGGGFWLAIGVLIVLNVPPNARVVRAAVLERRSLPYVEAAETLGVSPARVMIRHLLPNVLPVIAAAFFVGFTYALVDLSALSFLGLGVPPGSTDWGRMLAENRVLVFQNPWAAVAPGLALVLTAVSANLVGDWIYERFERRARSR